MADATVTFAVAVRTIIFSGLILILALVWNRTFEMLFELIFGERTRFIGQLVYAILLTCVMFIAIYIWFSVRRKEAPETVTPSTAAATLQ